MKATKITYNNTERTVLVGNATLVAQLSPKELTYVNASNETKAYKLATIAVDFGNGKTTEMLASVPQKIYGSNDFEVGAKYLTTIERVVDKNDSSKFVLLARMSALRTAEINQEAIDFAVNNLFGEVEVASTVEPAITV